MTTLATAPCFQGADFLWSAAPLSLVSPKRRQLSTLKKSFCSLSTDFGASTCRHFREALTTQRTPKQGRQSRPV